jgi:hypothetical protein
MPELIFLRYHIIFNIPKQFGNRSDLGILVDNLRIVTCSRIASGRYRARRRTSASADNAEEIIIPGANEPTTHLIPPERRGSLERQSEESGG